MAILHAVTVVLNFLLSNISWITAIGGLVSAVGSFGAAVSNLWNKHADSSPAVANTNQHQISRLRERLRKKAPTKRPRVITWLIVSLSGVLITVTSSLVGGAVSAQRQQEAIDYERGANSFAYLHLENLGTKGAHASIRHCGLNPARNVAFDIVRQSSMDPALSFDERNARLVKARLGDVYAGQDISLDRFDFPNWTIPERDEEIYTVFIRTEGGAFRQTIILRKVQENWGHFYVLRNFLETDSNFPRFSVYQAYIDPQLPVDLNDTPAAAAFLGRTLNNCADRLQSRNLPALPYRPSP